jgi:hypothetical protein
MNPRSLHAFRSGKTLRHPSTSTVFSCRTHLQPNKSMKMILNALGLALLLFSASSPCFALMTVMHVSKERAKEFGMEIRSKANGSGGVWVELEFKTEGQLKDFDPNRGSRVELQMAEGEKSLVTAALQIKRPSPGHVVVSFAADRAQLDKITLMVVVGAGAAVGGGYELRVKDFVELEKLR